MLTTACFWDVVEIMTIRRRNLGSGPCRLRGETTLYPKRTLVWVWSQLSSWVAWGVIWAGKYSSRSISSLLDVLRTHWGECFLCLLWALIWWMGQHLRKLSYVWQKSYVCLGYLTRRKPAWTMCHPFTE